MALINRHLKENLSFRDLAMKWRSLLLLITFTSQVMAMIPQPSIFLIFITTVRNPIEPVRFTNAINLLCSSRQYEYN